MKILSSVVTATLVVSACGTAPKKSGAVSGATGTQSSSSQGSLALALPSGAPANASQVNVVVAQPGCSSSSAVSTGSNSARGHKRHHHPGRHLAGPQPFKHKPFDHSGGFRPMQADGDADDQQTGLAPAPNLPPATSINTANASGSATNLPSVDVTLSGASASSCVVKDVTLSLASLSQLSVTGLPSGQFDVTVTLEDASGNALEQGSSVVQITNGQATNANISLSPLPAPASGSVNITIQQVVGDPAKLGFLAALSQAANACGVVKIAALDANGNQSPLSAALTLNLSSSSTTGVFYSDASCASPVTSVSIAAGSATATVYYKDTATGAPSLTIADPSSAGLGSATEAATVSAQ